MQVQTCRIAHWKKLQRKNGQILSVTKNIPIFPQQLFPMSISTSLNLRKYLRFSQSLMEHNLKNSTTLARNYFLCLCFLKNCGCGFFFSGYTPSDLMKISNIYAGLDLSNCSLEEVVEEKWVDPSCQSQRIYQFFLNASLQ